MVTGVATGVAEKSGTPMRSGATTTATPSTITMMVTHKFDFRKCPDRLADSSHLVWNILRCTSAEACTFDPFKDCPNSLGTDLVTCPSKSPGPDSGVGGGGGQ